MSDNINKKFEKLSSTVICHSSIKSILGKEYKRINDKIDYMKKEGQLKYLKRGMYIYNSPIFDNLISEEIISNNLLGPSYISFDYALSYYNLIPERVSEITSATIKRGKVFKTDYGEFSYKQVNKKLYSIGLNILSSKLGNFIIASKEKALCDKVLYDKKLIIKTQLEMQELLEYDLRIDVSDLEKFDSNIIKECYEITQSQKLKILFNLIEELKK